MEQIVHSLAVDKYEVQIERSAVKGIDGFKVRARGDDIEAVRKDAQDLYLYAQGITAPTGKAEVE